VGAYSLDDLVRICPDPIIGVDQNGTINRFNTAAERLLGYARNEVIDRMRIDSLYDPPEMARKVGAMMHSGEYGQPGQVEGYEAVLRARGGRRVDIRLSATHVYDDGIRVGSIGFFHDLTERKEMEAALKRLSVTDNLTGLFNQRHFHTCLHSEIDRARRYGRPLSLICIDLDGFKAVNDQLGHSKGDDVLGLIGEVLHALMRRADLPFRYGGDEFMLLLPETRAAEATALAERVRMALLARWPADWEAHHPDVPRVTLSLGAAELAPDEDGHALVKRADLAMYEAKRSGGDQTVLADERIGRLIEQRVVQLSTRRDRASR
jgi:diguanylate cyclase (GGDEF)-like protein/PAS domain S-box-containing protein